MLRAIVTRVGGNENSVEYQGDQLEIDFSEIGFDPDRPQFSICPKCSSDIHWLADGCRICGWSENQSKIDECSSKQSPPSKNCSRKIVPEFRKNCSRKTRRHKGEGSGAIFYRTVTKNGRNYQEAYYHWRENGKQRSKYIPKKLLDKVQEAESDKFPIADILEILQGGLQKC